MTGPPDVRYAQSRDGFHIAYQILGEDPHELVLVVGSGHPMDIWSDPVAVRQWERLASFCRLVSFDQRGAGRSDPVSLHDLPTLQTRVDDLLAVLDSARCRSVSLFACYDGAVTALAFAATHPERVAALVLVNCWARMARADDYPIGLTEDAHDSVGLAHLPEWGTGVTARLFAGIAGDEPGVRRRFARIEQTMASPGLYAALNEWAFRVDVRGVLPIVQTPTLVIHTLDSIIPAAFTRYVSEHIATATHLELPGRDEVIYWGESRDVFDHVEQFLTGSTHVSVADRVLATILVTDIVNSTGMAVSLGDVSWRNMLDDHDAMVRRQLDRFQGREVRSTGDGFLAFFDGATRAVRCAASISDGARQLGLQVRAGLHSGEIDLRGENIGGIAVHIAARISAMAPPGEVLVSSMVSDLVAGSGIGFTDRGGHELKGVPGTWKLYAVEG